MTKAYIIGTGAYLPERVVSNEEIAPLLGLDPAQIFKSSGIRCRRWAQAGTKTSELAAEALGRALANACADASEIDYLVFGTTTPDRFIPGTAATLQKLAGLRAVPALDIRSGCCSFLYAVQLAAALIGSEVARKVAICFAEIQSRWLDLSPQSGTISMLFGDGASAAIVSASVQKDALEVVDVLLGTDGSYADDLGIRSPGTEFGTFSTEHTHQHFQPRMKGQSVLLQANRKMPEACRKLLERNSLHVSDVAWMVPHQANENLLQQIARSLRLSFDRVVSVLSDYGNTSSASMGIALDSLRATCGLKAGEVLLMPAFGAGYTWGAAICRAVGA